MSESEHLSIHSIMENREQGYINAINILGKLRFEKSVNELIHLISDYDQSPESEIATTEAINALIDIGEPSVIPLTT